MNPRQCQNERGRRRARRSTRDAAPTASATSRSRRCTIAAVAPARFASSATDRNAVNVTGRTLKSSAPVCARRGNGASRHIASKIENTLAASVVVRSMPRPLLDIDRRIPSASRLGALFGMQSAAASSCDRRRVKSRAVQQRRGTRTTSATITVERRLFVRAASRDDASPGISWRISVKARAV